MRSLAKVVAAFVLACVTGLVMAQIPPSSKPTATVAASTSLLPPAALTVPDVNASDTPPPSLTAEDLSTFFGGFVPFALARGDVAGGVISVVKDGKVLFARGYGYADLKTRTPVSPETTLFRPGSTSKLFTWTAVMQLVEQGELDLDRDVNAYLDFTIPPHDGKPTTLRNLMTHTAGFEETERNLLARTPSEVDLEKYLKSHLPPRIFPPGEIVAYSNYGCGLAGYIVQRVSGERFEDYIQRHILEPLQMHHSSFAQPLSASLAPLLAKGYNSASDGRPQAFELVDPAPAGGMSASAMDMANFMIAQLQKGRFGDIRILQHHTAELMHSRQYTAAPGLDGMDLGFYQESSNGQRIIGHGGDTSVFHSDLHLMLDANVGVFMSFNSAGNDGATQAIRAALFDAFLDRYFPFEQPLQPTVATAGADAVRVAGWYQSSRRNDSTLKMMYVLFQTHVTALADGTIAVSTLTDAAGNPLTWREVGPLRYRETNGRHHLDFVTDAKGAIRYWATDAEPPVFVFQPVSGWKSLGSVGVWIPLALLFLLATLGSWPCGWLVRRHYSHGLESSPAQRRHRLGSRLGSLLLLLPFAGWLLLLIFVSGDAVWMAQGRAAPWMYLLYALGVLALLGALAILNHTIQSWRAPRRARWVLAGETLLALVAVYLAWVILAFGMITFSVNY